MSISVIVPTYNRAELLPATLDAILAQTLPPDEIIVVDDGSRDASLTVLQRYAPRVRTIPIENSGELVARNTGLRAACGDLVAFCDSDDLWRAGLSAAMAALWQAEPGHEVAYCDFVVVRDEAWEPRQQIHRRARRLLGRIASGRPDGGVFDQPVFDRLIRDSNRSFRRPWSPTAVFLVLGGWDEAASRSWDAISRPPC